MEKIKVLVVDDEEMARNKTKRVLEARGYNVDLAEDGVEGLKKIKAGAYNIALIDLGISGEGEMDGLKLIKKMKEICPETIKIIIADYLTIEVIAEVMRLETTYYCFEKPIDFDELLKIINQALNDHPDAIEKVEIRAENLIYEKYREKLEKEHQKGDFVTICFDTGEIIVDKDKEKVLDEAIERFGKGGFLFRRIGYDYVYSVGGGKE